MSMSVRNIFSKALLQNKSLKSFAYWSTILIEYESDFGNMCKN